MAKIQKFGKTWAAGTTDLEIHLWFIRQGREWCEQNGQSLLSHHREAQKIMYPSKKWHDWNNLLLPLFCDKDYIAIMGPASCVAGKTELVNPITGERSSIEELHRNRVAPIVMTLNGPAKAGIPFIKGFSELVEVVMKSGRRFTATPEHHVLSEHGYLDVSSLQIGQSLLLYEQPHPATNLDTDPSMSLEDALRLLKTVPDFQSDYPPDFHSCDEQLPLVSKIVPSVFPLQGDVPERIFFREILHKDVRVDKPSRSHPDQYSFHPSIGLQGCLSGYTENASFCRTSLENFLCAFDSCEQTQIFLSGTIPLQPFGRQVSCFSRKCYHPKPACKDFRIRRDVVQEIKPAGSDIFYDLEVPKYHHYFAEGLIHHNSGKSHEAVAFALTCYFANPNETAVLVSSTTRDALELRAWGEIKKYWGMARDKFDFIPGTIIGSKQRISSDGQDVEDRDFRKGISCVACKVGTTWVGLGPFVGIKQKHVILLADEASLMSPAFMEAISNLSKNENFKCIAMGNPKDRTDPLGMLAEPSDELGGWEGQDEKLETRTWATRYPNGIAVQLCGLDSPNMKAPIGERPPYPFLITRKTIESDIALYGQDSIKVTMMDYGIMPKSSSCKRVITRQMCTKRHAFEEPIWNNEEKTKVFGLDAAFGSIGGDRCIGCELNFGKDKDGNNIIAYIGDPILIPVSVRKKEAPQYQIAHFVKEECEKRGIPPENMFYDSTGKGQLGVAFSQIWSSAIVPVEFGGSATERPGYPDARILCCDQFDRMVSELWWATAWIIEAGQLRGLPESVAVEGFMKQWEERSQGTKIKYSVENKEKTKERVGRSPDLYDAFCVAVEGARQRGFAITHLIAPKTASKKPSLLEIRSGEYQKLVRSRQLQRI